MNWLQSLIARNPRFAFLLGKALLIAGGILVLGALFARIGLINLNAQRTEAKLPVLTSLAQAFPQYSTWAVPEGPVGYTVAAALVLAGLALVTLAEQGRGR